jgi:MFS family permease
MADDIAASDLTLVPAGGADVEGAGDAGTAGVTGTGAAGAGTAVVTVAGTAGMGANAGAGTRDAAEGSSGAGERGATHQPSQVTTRRGADLLAVSLMLIFITGAVTLSLMPVVTKDLQGRFGYSSADIGLLTSVFMGFYGVSGILSGVFAARWGGRLLAVCCGCFVVGSTIFGLSSSFAGFLIGKSIQGVGGGMVVAICGPVMATALPPRYLGRAWGIFGTGWGLGSTATLLVMPSLERAGGFRAVFLATAGLGLVVGIAALSQKAVRALPAQSAATTSLRGLAGSLGAVVVNRRVMLLGFTNTAALAMGVSLLVWAPSFLRDVHGSSEAISLYLVAGLGAAQFASSPVGAGAAGRWGKTPVIVGSLAVMVAATAVVGVVPGVILAFVMVLLTGFFSMFFFPPMQAYLPEVVLRPEQVGSATGINTLMGFTGSLVAPWVFGLFLDAGHKSHGAYIAGFLMLAAFGVAATIGMAFFRVPGRRGE